MPLWVNDLLTAQAVLGFIGSIPGAARAYFLARARGGSRDAALVYFFSGVVFAVGSTPALTPEGSPNAALVIGMLAGAVGGRFLDATYSLAPLLARKFLLGAVDAILGKAASADTAVRSDFGALVPIDRPDHAEVHDPRIDHRIDSPDDNP